MAMSRQKTGEGYVYYRDRASGRDVTVYEHQLVALLEYEPETVFSEEFDVHHELPARDVNLPEYLSVLNRQAHRSRGGDRYA
jgi:hypothetical protein